MPTFRCVNFVILVSFSFCFRRHCLVFLCLGHKRKPTKKTKHRRSVATTHIEPVTVLQPGTPPPAAAPAHQSRAPAAAPSLLQHRQPDRWRSRCSRCSRHRLRRCGADALLCGGGGGGAAAAAAAAAAASALVLRFGVAAADGAAAGARLPSAAAPPAAGAVAALASVGRVS